MPYVFMFYEESAKGDAEELARFLPVTLSKHLSVSTEEGKEGFLKPEDIKVKPRQHKKMDVHSQVIEILVLAHDYPERKINLEERKNAVLEDIKNFCLATHADKLDSSLWILLMPSAFGNFACVVI